MILLVFGRNRWPISRETDHPPIHTIPTSHHPREHNDWVRSALYYSYILEACAREDKMSEMYHIAMLMANMCSDNGAFAWAEVCLACMGVCVRVCPSCMHAQMTWHEICIPGAYRRVSGNAA